ncbi:uncharacterized protein LOC127715730 [Mytilus californianus]|uniref:uncharacterized protein LOC127715730 n=1 Tax=Mytilus californianus TaxID=6549 RepID=UPI0022486AAF|nr:uncharacterized protein LOC127715730 [Mytilus californianus]
MDDILNEVKELSVADLRSKLLEVGEKVGPITATTQNLFQKRLAKRLYQIQHPELSTSEAKEKDVVNNNAIPDNVNSEKIVAKVKDTEDSKTSDVPPVFFGVCLPQGVDKKETEDEELVFKDKAQALQAVKKYAGARFKVFKSRQDARLFSQSSADEPSPSPWKPSSPKATDGFISTMGTGVSFESSPYKAPKVQEISKFRLAIEQGDTTTIETLVWENPRFLISSADTPLIIQEGPRYNALHVAAKSNQPQVCQLILDILEDPSFLDKLYGHTKETECTRTDRMNFVVDLYLNTPDKGCCESPLHFACKFGYTDVVAVLASHPKVDKILKNKYAETPRDVICTRLKTPTQDQKAEIRDLLEGQFYVPLLRAEDNSTQPLIGQPWSPDSSKVPLNVATGTWSPKDPLMAVKACAGPMTPSKAVLFHKRWMTPPSGSPDHVKQKFVFTKREDSDKGVERIGREIAHEYQIPWVEYWSFLQTYADLTTEDGLDLFEDFLHRQSLGLCIAEKIDKIEVKSDTEDSFITANQSSNPMNSSFLNSSLFQSINGSLGQRSISPQILEENSFLCKGLPKTSSPLNTSEMEESLHLPKHNIYDYGKNYMTWSMDSSDFMQESFSASSSPMGCLTALFSKLSLLDRSIRQKRRSVSCNSCIGDRSASSPHEKNGSKPYNSPPRGMDPISENYEKRDINKNIELCEKKPEENYCNGSVPNRVCDDIAEENSSDENTDRSQSPASANQFEDKNVSLWRDKANDSNSSSLSSLSDEGSKLETCDVDENVQMVENDIKQEKKDVIIESKFNLEEKVTCEPKNDSNSKNKGLETGASNVDDLTDKFDQKVCVSDVATSECSQTPERKRRTSGKEKPTYVHLDIVFEMNKNKTPENIFEAMFEAVNERRKSNMNLEEMDFMKFSDDVWNRDFVIDYDLTQSDLREGQEIHATVAVVPLNMNLNEMKVFPRVPFKLTSCEYLNTAEVNFADSIVIVNLKFHFVREQMKQALLVRNCFYQRSYFINGPLPTKTDLDAHRAMDDHPINKTDYPYIHRWRSLISARMSEIGNEWPSPARVHQYSNLSSSFPQITTPRMNDSSLLFRSPRAPLNKMTTTWTLPNVRTKLFNGSSKE